MVISQIITGDLVTAVEVYNTGANSITLTSANFGVQISPDNKQNNIQTWSPTSNLTLGGREVLVVVAAGSQKDAFISYLNEVNANFVDASATLSSADNDAIQIAYNASGTILANGNSAIDRIGDWLKSNAGFSGQSNITDENLERELEHLFTGYMPLVMSREQVLLRNTPLQLLRLPLRPHTLGMILKDLAYLLEISSSMEPIGLPQLMQQVHRIYQLFQRHAFWNWLIIRLVQ